MAVDLVSAAVANHNAMDAQLNAYRTFDATTAIEQAKAVDTYDDVKEASVRISDALQAAGASLYQNATEEQPDPESSAAPDDDVIDAEFEEK